MKKTLLVRILSVLLVFVLCLGVASCTTESNSNDNTDNNANNTDNSTDDPGNTETPDDPGNNETPDDPGNTETPEEPGNTETPDDPNKPGDKPLTAEEKNKLFADLKAACEATSAYNGAITVNGVDSSIISAEDVFYEVGAEIVYSVDPESGRFVSIETESDGEDEGKEIEKSFFEGDQLYLYDCDVLEEYEEYSKAPNKEYVLEYLNDNFTVGRILEIVLGGVLIAGDYTELVNAFDSTYPEICENTIAQGLMDGDIDDNTTLTLESMISILEEDGVITLTVTSVVNIGGMILEDADYKAINMNMTRSISCADGKICEVGYILSMESVLDPESDAEAEYISEDLTMSFSYEFDEDLYESVEVSLPENPDDIYDSTNDEDSTIYLDIVFGNLKCEDMSIYGADCVESVLESISDEVYYSLDETLVTVKGFYKDAELTQEIDPETMSLEELVELGAVYLDIEILDGYAIINIEETTENNISREYQIVMNQISYDGYWGSYIYWELQDITTPIELEYETISGEDYKVLVNGEEVEDETFVAESGETYTITYVTIFGDENVTLEHIFSLMV